MCSLFSEVHHPDICWSKIIVLLEKQATEVILVGWFGKCQSIKKVGGRRFVEGLPVSGSLFVSPCPPECDFQSETKIEPDFRLLYFGIVNTNSYKYRWFFYSKLCFDVTEWFAHVDGSFQTLFSFFFFHFRAPPSRSFIIPPGGLSRRCISYSTDYYQRLTLERWFTNLDIE